MYAISSSSWPDWVNAGFEAFAVFAVWSNVWKLNRDRDVKGITWWYMAVFSLWGYWNPFYYGHLVQGFSQTIALGVAAGNSAWVLLWLKIRREKRMAECRICNR